MVTQETVVGTSRKSIFLGNFDFFGFDQKSFSAPLGVALWHWIALTSSDSDNLCALNNAYYAGGSHCGEWVTIRNKNTGAQTAVRRISSFVPLLIQTNGSVYGSRLLSIL